jgi:hypothetical protein
MHAVLSGIRIRHPTYIHIPVGFGNRDNADAWAFPGINARALKPEATRHGPIKSYHREMGTVGGVTRAPEMGPGSGPTRINCLSTSSIRLHSFYQLGKRRVY